MFKERFTRRQGFERVAGVAGAAVLAPELIPVRIKILTYHALSSPDQIYNDVIALMRYDANRTPKTGYFPTDLDTAVKLISHEESADQHFLVVTCDDGLSSQMDNARAAAERIEKETGSPCPVEFFVLTKLENSPDPVEEMPDETLSYFDGNEGKHANLGQLKTIARAGIHKIRNHTVNHATLPNLTIDARNGEVEDGEKKVLAIYRSVKAKTPRKKVFAYPRGAYAGQIDYILSHYDMAVSTEAKEVHFISDMGHIGREGKS